MARFSLSGGYLLSTPPQISPLRRSLELAWERETRARLSLALRESVREERAMYTHETLERDWTIDV